MSAHVGSEPLLEEELLKSLRAKYLDLCRKYTSLLERSQQRPPTQQMAFHRLSSWAVSVTPIALALVREGNIEVTNQRFSDLSSPTLVWRAEQARANEPAQPLPALVLARAAEMRRSGALVSEMRLRARDRTLSLRLERTRRPPQIMVLAQDVTEQARGAEDLQLARDALIQQERLRILGETAAAVAHDLGSTLRSLAFRLGTLDTDIPLRKKHEANLRALSQGVEEAAAIVRRLHEFARSGSLELEQVQLGAILRQALEMFELETESLKLRVNVEIAVGPLPFVRGSAAELSHLFFNLLRNARDAMRESGGTVTIKSRVTSAAVRIDIIDTGPGVARENLDRLFQPFFTTHTGEGSGLGLWLAAGTMRRVGGTISARRLRRGMVFSLVFPRGRVSRAGAQAPRVATRGGSALPAPRRPGRAPRTG